MVFWCRSLKNVTFFNVGGQIPVGTIISKIQLLGNMLGCMLAIMKWNQRSVERRKESVIKVFPA